MNADISLVNIISIVSAASFVVMYAFIFFFLSSRKKRQDELHWTRRLGEILKSPLQKEIKESSLIKEPSSDPAFRFKSKLPKVEGFKQWLQHAGFTIDPIVFIGASISLGFIIFFILWFAFGADFLFSLLFGTASSFILPWLFITYFTNVEKNKFLADFPIALDMIHRALRAGHSSERAIEMVATRVEGPVGKVFQQISEKMNLGGPPEIVLTDISNQIGIDEFRMLSIVLILQRETGGSLAEAIENFSKIIRARQNLKKKVSALTGEVRATAAVLTSIPFVIVSLIYVSSPKYLDSLFYTSSGHTLLLIGGGMLLTGITIIFRMAYKDIY